MPVVMFLQVGKLMEKEVKPVTLSLIKMHNIFFCIYVQRLNSWL